MAKKPIQIGRATILAYHLIWTAYGWWLPNDLRGSMSRAIASDVLKELGELHFGRKRVQPTSREIRAFYERAKDLLKFPLMTFAPEEVDTISRSFAREIKRRAYTCYACAIMPDHVHVLIRKHRDSAEQMIANLQDASREAVLDLRIHPNGHPVWGGHGWKVFLDSPDDIRRTIRYIEENPVNLRMPRRSWGFVTVYDGWSFGGHMR
jgi:REP element-mobilizing transposase RayT